MNKLPVGAAIAGAYRFLFTRLISIIGTMWLPLVVSAALVGGILFAAVPHEWWTSNPPHYDDAKSLFAAAQPLLCAYPLLLLISWCAGAMILAGLMRHALGQKSSTTFIYFSFGAPFWRMLAARLFAGLLLLLLAVVLVAGFIAAAAYAIPTLPHAKTQVGPLLWLTAPWRLIQMRIACGIAGASSANCPDGRLIAGLVVLGIVEACVYIYAAIRLTFFLPAVVVAEKKIGLGRAWSLGGGNFWRIAVTAAATALPVIILVSIIERLTVRPVMRAELLHSMPHGPHHHIFLQAIVSLFHAYWVVLPTFLTIAVVEQIALLGLITGAIGAAYNATAAPKIDLKSTVKEVPKKD